LHNQTAAPGRSLIVKWNFRIAAKVKSNVLHFGDRSSAVFVQLLEGPTFSVVASSGAVCATEQHSGKTAARQWY
jgi:hypothetical protein